MRNYWDIFIFRLLKKSRIAKYWLDRVYSEVIFDLEISDIDYQGRLEKYKAKLKELRA